MEKTLINTSRQLLKALYRQRDKLNKELQTISEYTKVKLQVVRPVGHDRAYYYQAIGKKRQYIGTGSNEKVQRTKEAHYLARSLDIVIHDIELLENIVNGYQYSDFQNVNLSLAKAYRVETLNYSNDANHMAQKWLQSKAAEKERYGSWYPEGLIHRVSNGIYVRTKSEMAIAEILLRNEIPFIYELPHRLKNGAVVHTDFTMLSTIDYKTEKLLEHEGSMDDPKYRKKHAWRVENYYESGYIPNVNLFFTFDGLNGSIDGESIQHIIDGWLKPVS